MTTWTLPPIIKVYEALGCIADITRIHKHLEEKPLSLLGKKTKPPSDY